MFYVNSTDIVARNQRTKENIIKSLYSPLSSPVHNDSFTNCAYLFLLNLCEFCVRGLQLSHMVLPHAHTMGSLFVFHGILSLCSCLEKLQQQRMLLRVRRDIYSITECHPSILFHWLVFKMFPQLHCQQLHVSIYPSFLTQPTCTINAIPLHTLKMKVHQKMREYRPTIDISVCCFIVRQLNLTVCKETSYSLFLLFCYVHVSVCL